MWVKSICIHLKDAQSDDKLFGFGKSLLTVWGVLTVFNRLQGARTKFLIDADS